MLAICYVGVLVLVPVVFVCWRTFEHGVAPVWDAITQPDVVHAFQVTAIVTGTAVVLNTVFGVGMALLIARYRFPGRRLLDALIDLPLALSPVVVGLALVLVYGQAGWLGRGLASAGFQVIYAIPGMVLATAFVSLPLVVREVLPVLQEAGTDQEQAAQSLGANALQRFWRITLPTIRWALAYGVVLSLARSLGEFGAVKIVSGNLLNETQTTTLIVEQRYQDFDENGAYAASFVLMATAILCMVITSLIRPKEDA